MTDKKEMYTQPSISSLGNIKTKTFDDSGWSCSIDCGGGDDDSSGHHH
jgi:hypothetical protein